MSDSTRRADRAPSRRGLAKPAPAGEAALLRLQPGGLATLNAASQLCGLSRSAFARDCLVPLALALAARLGALRALAERDRVDLAQALEAAIDARVAALASAPRLPATPPLRPKKCGHCGEPDLGAQAAATPSGHATPAGRDRAGVEPMPTDAAIGDEFDRLFGMG